MSTDKHKRYNASEKGRARDYRYNKSAKGYIRTMKQQVKRRKETLERKLDSQT